MDTPTINIPVTFLTVWDDARRNKNILVQATTAGIEKYYVFYGINNNVLRFKKPNVGLPIGAYGCYLSHYLLLQNTLTRYDEYEIILEDDVNLHPLFLERVQESMTYFPAHADMGFFAWNKRQGGKTIDIGNTHWIEVTRTLCAYAYIIRKCSIQKLLTQMHEIKDCVSATWSSLNEAGKFKIVSLKEPAGWHNLNYKSLTGLDKMYKQVNQPT